MRKRRSSNLSLLSSLGIITLAQLGPTPPFIETPEGPIPLPVVFPINAPPVQIPHLPDGYRWTDVAAYTVNLAHSIFDRVFGGTEQIASNIRDFVDTALNAAQTSWSSFVQWNMMLTLTTFDDVTQTVQILEGAMLSHLSDLWDEIHAFESFVANLGIATEGWVLDNLSGLERWVVQGIDQAVNDLKTWVWDDVVNPAVTALERVIEAVRDDVTSELQTLRDDVTGLIDTETFERLLAIAGLWAAVNAITDYVDECGEPMCETMGPKTDLGKALKALEGLLGLLAGFAVAGLTEADLERLAAMLATGIAGPSQDLLTGFVSRGETVGGAASEVVGDIGHVGLDLLRELGIPV